VTTSTTRTNYEALVSGPGGPVGYGTVLLEGGEVLALL